MKGKLLRDINCNSQIVKKGTVVKYTKTKFNECLFIFDFKDMKRNYWFCHIKDIKNFNISNYNYLKVIKCNTP